MLNLRPFLAALSIAAVAAAATAAAQRTDNAKPPAPSRTAIQPAKFLAFFVCDPRTAFTAPVRARPCDRSHGRRPLGALGRALRPRRARRGGPVGGRRPVRNLVRSPELGRLRPLHRAHRGA